MFLAQNNWILKQLKRILIKFVVKIYSFWPPGIVTSVTRYAIIN